MSLAKPLSVAAAAALVVVILGGAVTDIGPWYRALKMPAWKPPDWAFGPIWLVIFSLCAIAAALAWRAGDARQRRVILTLFMANAGLNLLWSALFFGLGSPRLALYEVPFLWASVLALMIVLWPVHRGASLMMAPYLAWVSVASMLNLSIVRLNGL